MKKLLIIIFIAISGNLLGFTLNITSSVLDINSSTPIANHKVYIESLDSSFMYMDSVLTDINGNYNFTVNNVYSQNIQFVIITYDCNNSQQIRIVSTSSTTTTSFLICSNNPIPSCNAQFYYYADSINPNTYNFINQSTNYSFSSWYINNSLVSNQNNFIYTFNTNPSINTICLVVTDSLNSCSDSTCSTIIINNCSVTFSSNSNGLTTNFIAISNPLANYFQWDFGDGNSQTTNTNSITHTYNSAGAYFATLTTISIYNQAQDTCFASATDSINVINPTNTGSIYGYVFADSIYLIDGTIELYTKNLNTQKLELIEATNLLPDSTLSSTYFIFNGKVYGEYYVKAIIDNSSIFYNSFYDTWFGNTLSWESAQLINLNSNYAAANIILKKPEVTLSGGNGSISGKIISDEGIDVLGTKVYLFTENNYLIKESILNPSGGFYFDSLVNGSYKIYPELTNYYSQPLRIEISQETPDWENIIIGLDSNGFYVQNNKLENIIQKFEIFPNPANERINILIESRINEDANISIYNIMGTIIYSKDINISNRTMVEIPINNLNNGVYFVTVSTNYTRTTKKIIKQ